MLLKIGELADRTGLTIRTLRHYHNIGLLVPSTRSDAGYRLYRKDDVLRLHRIQALKQLGLALADIGHLLDGDGATLPAIVTRQLAALEREMAQAAILRTQLLRMQQLLGQGEEPTLADLLSTLESMTMHEKYFSEEQMKALEAHQLAARDDLAEHWPALVAAVRSQMEHGVAPDDAATQALARRWMSMTDTLVGGDPALLIKLDAMTRNEAAVQAETGIDPAMLAYIGAAMAVLRAPVYAPYLDQAQQQHLAASGPARAAQWPPLFAQARLYMERGEAIDSPPMQALARAWRDLFDATFGSGPEVRASMRAATAAQPEILHGTGLDPHLLDFMRSAIAALPA